MRCSKSIKNAGPCKHSLTHTAYIRPDHSYPETPADIFKNPGAAMDSKHLLVSDSVY